MDSFSFAVVLLKISVCPKSTTQHSTVVGFPYVDQCKAVVHMSGVVVFLENSLVDLEMIAVHATGPCLKNPGLNTFVRQKR